MNAAKGHDDRNLPPCEKCAVRCFALFQPLSNEEAEAVSQHRLGHYRIFGKQHLYRRGDLDTPTFTLCKGWIMLYRVLKDGHRQVIRVALPGDLLGFRPDAGIPIDHSALALTDCQVCAFPDSAVLCRDHPSLSWRLAVMNGLMFRLLEAYLAAVAHRNARERIAFLLLELYQRLEARNLGQEGRCFFPLTQEEIGDTLGLTAVHVNRILQGLRRAGIVQLRQRELRIHDYPALQQLGSLSDHLNIPDTALA